MKDMKRQFNCRVTDNDVWTIFYFMLNSLYEDTGKISSWWVDYEFRVGSRGIQESSCTQTSTGKAAASKNKAGGS